MMNKKAIAVKFLVTILLALIIFVPACLFMSEILRVSDQAKDSFNEFLVVVKDFADEPDNSRASFLLKIDQGTFVAFFDKEAIEKKEILSVETGVSWGEKDFHYPAERCGGEPCLCLCQEYEKKERIAAVCNKLLCQKAGEHFMFDDKFIIRRTAEDDVRRVLLQLEKKEGLIHLTMPEEEEKMEPASQADAETEGDYSGAPIGVPD